MTLGVYIHAPFCVVKCPYCDFYSGVFDDRLVPRFVTALERELELRAPEVAGRRARSIFMGGGTPTHLPVGAVARILHCVSQTVELTDDVEITVEANPESFTDAKADELLDAGVTRVSLGVQSLDDAVLATLGRPHDGRMALAAARRARERFVHASFDLIVAVPGMTRSVLESSLQQLLDLEPDHLSAYGLTIEPGTGFAAQAERGDLVPLDEAPALELDALVNARTSQAGLERYEVSNHARPAAECRHNLDIWRGGFYLGVGPGAHSYVPSERTHGRRIGTVRDLHGYLAAIESGDPPPAEVEETGDCRRLEERLLLGLRLSEGIDLDVLASEVGIDCGPPRTIAGLRPLVDGGLLEVEGSRLRTTPRGRLLLDRLIPEVLAALPQPPSD